MTNTTKVKNRIIWFLTFSPLIWLIIYFLFHIIVFLPNANQEEMALQRELSLITPPDEAQLKDSGAGHKTDQASAYNRHAISWSPDEIFSYYDVELARHGWYAFDQGYSRVTKKMYCKDNYTAWLDYDDLGNPWDYQLWLSAGRTSKCEMVKGGGSGWFPLPLSDLWFSLACSTSWLILWIPVGWASWRKKDKYLDWFGVGRRIVSTFIIIICLLVFLLSIYKITMFLQNG